MPWKVQWSMNDLEIKCIQLDIKKKQRPYDCDLTFIVHGYLMYIIHLDHHFFAHRLSILADFLRVVDECPYIY